MGEGNLGINEWRQPGEGAGGDDKWGHHSHVPKERPDGKGKVPLAQRITHLEVTF